MNASFIKRLCEDAFASKAVNHPYLTALAQGDLPNIGLALKDFAYQYGAYNNQFTHYLGVVIENLTEVKHKNILLENLAEEQGNPHDIELSPMILASIDGKPHSALYTRFQEALGVNAQYRQSTPLCEAALTWSEQFSKLCESSEYSGIGAIGIGTELIVSNIYEQILESLRLHSSLTPIERVFFNLHSACDDEHAAQILAITEDLATDDKACETIAQGVYAAIELRVRFWDDMLERAQQFPAQASSDLHASVMSL